MKKTNYSFMVSCGSVNCINGIWRRVYEENGKFFVKYLGETNDVTHYKDKFVAD